MSELDNVRRQRNEALDRIAVLELELAEARARASTYGDKVVELSEKLQASQDYCDSIIRANKDGRSIISQVQHDTACHIRQEINSPSIVSVMGKGVRQAKPRQMTHEERRALDIANSSVQ